MAKCTLSSAFRKIDIDQYCEDNFKEDEADLGGSLGPDETEIITLLNQYPFLCISLLANCRNIDALKTVLHNAPLGCKNQQIKDAALNLTLKVLLSIKSSQIEDAVNNLDRDMIDVLMKYVYRGFEIPSEGSSGHLLLWHEKAYSIGGVGCIVRVLSDSKRA
ncbi:Actin-related protein 2/3 complex subunit 5 [Carabus blaptoides fortunei]